VHALLSAGAGKLYRNELATRRLCIGLSGLDAHDTILLRAVGRFSLSTNHHSFILASFYGLTLIVFRARFADPCSRFSRAFTPSLFRPGAPDGVTKVNPPRTKSLPKASPLLPVRIVMNVCSLYGLSRC
jgi:hypothetical protein